MSAKTFFRLILRQNQIRAEALLQNQPLAAAQIGGACYNNIGGCSAPAQIGSQTHTMTLKKVLADIQPLFRRILKRQHNPIRHVGDRADNKVNISVPGISTNPLETGLGFQQFHPVRPTLL